MEEKIGRLRQNNFALSTSLPQELFRVNQTFVSLRRLERERYRQTGRVYCFCTRNGSHRQVTFVWCEQCRSPMLYASTKFARFKSALHCRVLRSNVLWIVSIHVSHISILSRFPFQPNLSDQASSQHHPVSVPAAAPALVAPYWA